MEHKLCRSCQAIFSRTTQPEDGKLYPHHADEAHFRAAVAAGCFICLSLRAEIELSKSKETGLATATTRYDWSLTSDYGDQIVDFFDLALFCRGFGNSHLNQPANLKQERPSSVHKVRFELRPAIADSESPERVSLLRQPHTASTTSIGLAECWLRSCKQQHKRCASRKEDSRWVPSRLVDLEAEDAYEGGLRIIETDKEPVTEEYMTLSHRWGPQKFPMFNETNRKRMTKGFSVASLPQTFWDAIQIVRRFGIRYLWVDCLCILQENAEDFEKEAQLMHQVYGNSYCNICATGARDNSEPLFNDRNPKFMEPLQLELGWQSQPRGKYTIFDSELWKHGVFLQPVNRRAWVMQERFLAPCVLHFGKQQLFWECRELHACEQYPSGIPEAIIIAGYDLKTIDSPREEDLDLSTETKVYKLWNVLLFTYTRCGLTEASDKLIALAGTAAWVSQTLNDTYLAGLWQSYLMYDLLWKIHDIQVGITRPRNYRAPSWSWASVDGPLNLGGSTEMLSSARLACTILDASVGLNSSNSFGTVKFACLKIRARLKKVSIMHEMLTTSPKDWHFLAMAGSECGTKMNDISIRCNMTFDDAPAPPPTENMWCFCVRQEDQEEENVWVHDEDDGSDLENMGGCNDDAVRTVPFRHGLIITPSGHRKGDFQRLGVFYFAGESNLRLFEDNMAGDENSWPCNAYDEVERLHTFTLV